MTTPTPLDYAPRTPGHIRRHGVRYAILLVLLLIASTIFYYRQPLLAQARILYWQRQCLRYTRPPDTVIAELDPQRADDLIRGDHDYQHGGRTPAAVLWPECQRQYMGRALHQTRTPSFYRGPGPTTIFLHERRSPSGNRRLVVIETSATVNALTLPHLLITTVIEPATLISPPRYLPNFQTFQYTTKTGPFVPAHLSYAQPDPADLSHFTIDFTLNDHLENLRHGVIDAHLNDDDTVIFTLRDPATTQNL